MSHLCGQLVAAARYLEMAGMSERQLSRLHHFSLKGRRVRFAEAYLYFGTNKELGQNNVNYAERLKYVAARHKESGESLDSLIDQALSKWPLKTPQSHSPISQANSRLSVDASPGADLPLGFRSAVNVVNLGRAAFFGTADIDLPQGRSPQLSQDDLLPQFGYVGSRFTETRVLLLGINPGNGSNDWRSRGDEVAVPALHEFVQDRTPASFLVAQHAYQRVCESWPMWSRHCSEVIGAGLLHMDEIAYSNCLPWRTASESNVADSVSVQTVKLYAYPLIEELQPRVIIAMGKKAARILAIGGRRFENLIVWNRAQVATPAVIAERASAAAEILLAAGRRSS